MFFSKITLQKESLDIVCLSRLARADGYSMHQRIWRLFAEPSVKVRDFIFRQETENGWPCFYVVSKREPLRAEEMWRISTKPYIPKIRSKERFAFVLRANPVKTTKNSQNRKPARHDVIMEAKTRLRTQGVQKSEWPSTAEIVQIHALRWLAARSVGYGFHVTEQTVRAEGYQQRKYFKGQGIDPICFSTVDYTGLLTVNDPDRFVTTLYRGIGHSKGFGCGMLMVRRV